MKEWLQTHSYDNISFWKHTTRPPTATVELFRGLLTVSTDATEQQFTTITDTTMKDSQDKQDTQDLPAKRRMPTRQCIQCKLYRSRSFFTPTKWEHAANKLKQGKQGKTQPGKCK